ncbi:MAG: tyrosine-type recombinase/integrase [Pseudanabaenaceae cyanobacterium]
MTAIVLQESVATDAQLIQLWVHGKSKTTARYYLSEADRFLAFVGKSLAMVTLADLQAYADELDNLGLQVSSQSRSLSVVKSLLTFGQKIGVLTFNVGAVLTMPKAKNKLSERILSESEVHGMIALETNHRNKLIIKLLYGAGLRVSELCDLKWCDLKPSGESGQITVFGKGGKTRSVLLPVALYHDLQALRGDKSHDEPIFMSRKGHGHLDPSMVMRIVRAAAARVGITQNVSPHWLRHCHASHSLDRGAPITLVQQTLGHSNVATTSKYLHARPNDSSARYLAV